MANVLEQQKYFLEVVMPAARKMNDSPDAPLQRYSVSCDASAPDSILKADPQGEYVRYEDVAALIWNAALDAALNCYSPDESANDWSDKIRALKRSRDTGAA